jgi:His-Xaa-Ser system radical SAM maturase HxsC
MNLFLSNYYAESRIAKIVKDDCIEQHKADIANEREWLVIGKSKAFFMIDGYQIARENYARLSQLDDGDIIFVDDHGILYRLFSAREHDATIYITGHCNSNCLMCPSSDAERKNSSGLSDEWLANYIDMLPVDVSHLVVTGGEPTLRIEAFFYVMRRVADKFPKVETLLLTNGRSFAARKLMTMLLEHCPPYLCVAIPLHGHAAWLHDKITRVEGSFRQTCEGISHLLAQKISVEIRIVVTKLNYKHLEAIARLIIDRYSLVFVVNFIGLETRGNCARNFEQVYIAHREAFQYLKPAVRLLLNAGIDAAIYNFPLCAVEQGYWEICRKSITPEKIRFAEECACCAAKSYCGGFFHTTFSMVKPRVEPVKKQEGDDWARC